MTVSDGNRGQANFWAGAGPLWKQLQAQLDVQVGGHGLAAIDALAPQSGDRIVDVGFGTGTSSFPALGADWW